MFEKEQQLKKEFLMYTKGQPEGARPSPGPFERHRRRIRELLAAKRQTLPNSPAYPRLAAEYNEILNDMIDNGLDRPIEDELLDEDLLSGKYVAFEREYNKTHAYTLGRFVREKCAYVFLAEVFEVGANTARVRVVRQYKGELDGDVIKSYVPWGLAKWYEEGERAVVFLDEEKISLGRLGRMPVVERGGVEYAASFAESRGFWPEGARVAEEKVGGERAFLIELGECEAILTRVCEAITREQSGRSRLSSFCQKFDRDSLNYLKEATGEFKKATELDESSAKAHSGLAACYATAGIYNVAPPEESFGKALAPAKRAIELDARLAEAHAALGYALMCYEWDWPAAEAEYRRAIAIDPDFTLARQGLAHLLAAMKRFSEALREINHARKVEPKSLMVGVVRGFILYYKKDYEKSWEQFNETKELDRHFDAAYYGMALAGEPLALAYWEEGEVEKAAMSFAEARQAARRAVRFSRGNTVKLAAQAHVDALAGEEEQAEQELQQLIALREQVYVSPFQIATIYAAMVTTSKALDSNRTLDYYNKALEYLKEAYRTRDQWMVLLNVEPRFSILRGEDEFKELIARLKFPPEPGEAAEDERGTHPSPSETEPAPSE